MSDLNPGWSVVDISDAAKVLHTLLKNLEPHKGAKRRHRDDLQYLQHYLLPKLLLIQNYVKDVGDNNDHPRKGGWEADLGALAQAWQKFEDYLYSRYGLLLESPSHDSAEDDVAWTWDELSEKIQEIKLTSRDALDDIDRLSLLEICDRFGLVLPKLDTMFEKIESYGQCVSTYRKDVQDVLYTIRSNKQDFKSLENLLHGSMAELARKISDSQSETDAIKAQLHATSEKLDRLLALLAEQRGNCTTKTDKKYLDQLRKEVQKQADSVARLRASVDETMSTMAEFSHALEKLNVWRGVSQCASGALNDLNDMLSKTVSSLERLCDNLKRQTSLFTFKALFWRRTKPTEEVTSSEHDDVPNSPSPPEESSPDATGAEDNESANSSTLLESSPPPLSQNHTSSSSSSSPPSSIVMALTAPPHSPMKSAGFSIQDLATLLAASPEEAAEAAAAATAITWALSNSPPPLPRRSSGRKSYQYVLHTLPQRQSQPVSLLAVPGQATPARAAAASTAMLSSPHHSSTSSWSSMSLPLSSSELDSPCRMFSRPMAWPSAPSSVYESSIPELTTSYAADADADDDAGDNAVVIAAERTKQSSLFDLLEQRYSLTVVATRT
ncbi:hypothetical protein AYL99_11214 [Fonsecaea erecta]|uniref:Uncharacterized protein n=1 Tax=Fonsecaea erecta TaxID=1367422 RepID=A0A178Z5M6_9EURO|nr:hypothetical protein AYL99_11214 [Fonsecaea erecta]OAP54766.1 hypothetical protein AYL99_11214 [Fonsecaea erecta]